MTVLIKLSAIIPCFITSFGNAEKLPVSIWDLIKWFIFSSDIAGSIFPEAAYHLFDRLQMLYDETKNVSW